MTREITAASVGIARRRTEEERADAFFLCEDDDGGGFQGRCASGRKQDASWVIVGSNEQADIKITPAHQVGDVAPRYLHRSDVGEDSRPVQLVKE
jgi:hypothetical protein